MTELISLEDLREEFFANPDVRAGYEAAENEFALANALILARSEANLSQEEVAERMNTTLTSVARMESGRRAPSMASLARYATAVGQTIRIEIHPAAAPTNAKA